MSYYFKTTLHTDFNTAIEKTTEALAAQGFGVLTEIDVQATLKKKIDADFRPYRILGACNPPFAHQALQADEHIGLMLPCNFIVQQKEDNTIEVAAVDPLASMQAVENPAMEKIATEVRNRIKEIIENLAV